MDNNFICMPKTAVSLNLKSLKLRGKAELMVKTYEKDKKFNRIIPLQNYTKNIA